MTKLIRILHVTGMAHAGAGQHVLSLASGCNPRRFDVTVAMASDSPMRPQFERRGVRVMPLRMNHFGGVRKNLVALGQLVRLMRSEKFDIVHTHTSVAGAIGRVAARLASGAQTLHMVHAFASHDRRPWPSRALALAVERSLDRLTDRYVCGSQAMIDRGDAKRIFSRAKATLIHYGIEPAALDPSPAPAESEVRLPAGDGAPVVVGFVGRLEEQKGTEFLLRAAALIQRRGANVRFLIAGDGLLRGRLERLAAELGVGPIVEFVGWQRDVAAMLRRIDILAMPSLWESFGLSAAEAMAMQKPVVAAGVEGLLEVVDDGVTGLLISPADPGALAAAILELAADPSRRQAMGAAGRAHVERLFTIQRTIASHERLYQQMLGAEAARTADNQAANRPLTYEVHAPRFAGQPSFPYSERSPGSIVTADDPDSPETSLESCHE